MHLYQDRQGSVVLATKKQSSSVMHGRAQYDPYGKDISDSVWRLDGVGQPYGYAGARWDSAAGLYLMGARWYAPEMGRFVELDPIGEGGGWNLYNYVGSSPTMWVDPSGLRAQVAGGISIPGQSGSQVPGMAVYMDGVRVENGGGWMAFAQNHQQSASDAGLRAEDQRNSVHAATDSLEKAVDALKAATGNGADPEKTAGLVQDVADATTRLASLAGAAAGVLSDGQVNSATDALSAAGEALQDYQSAGGSGPRVLSVKNATENTDGGATKRDMLVATARLTKLTTGRGFVVTPAAALQPRDIEGGNKALRVTTLADSWLSHGDVKDPYGKVGSIGGSYGEVYSDRIQSDLTRDTGFINDPAYQTAFGIVEASDRIGTAIGNVAGHEFGHEMGLRHPQRQVADENGVLDPFPQITNLMGCQHSLCLLSPIPVLPR